MLTAVEKVARALFDSGCIKFGNFKIKSGATSPYYIDLARSLSLPSELCTITEVAANKIKEIRRSEPIDKLASIELKGALLLPGIGCRVGIPCVIVRKENKAYGVTGRIAGADVTNGENILFFDDVVSEGLSKIEGIKPLQELGANVKHFLVVVDREQGGREKLEKSGYRVHALAKISEVVASLRNEKCISEQQAATVLEYISK